MKTNKLAVVYQVTLDDETGFNYLSSRNTWVLDHEDGMAFATIECASAVAATVGGEVLCSGSSK